jgi:hypothetical protein
LKRPAIALDQNISDEESVVQIRELRRSTTHKNLTHGRSKMGDGSRVVSHPLSQLLILDILLGWDQQLSAQEQWGKNITLNRIVGDSRQHSFGEKTH